jgi:hypothetical protein
MLLKFTSYNISRLEEEVRLPFSTLLGTGKLSDIAKLVKTGMNVDDMEVVHGEIDKFLAEGKSINDLLVYIVEKLEQDHFLEPGTKELMMEEVKKQKQLLSPKSGKKVKEQPST